MQSPELAELKRRGDAAFAEAQQAIAKSHQIVRDVMAVQAELRVAREQYANVVGLGGSSSVHDLPQVRRWDKDRVARQTAYLLALAGLHSQTRLVESFLQNFHHTSISRKLPSARFKK